MSPFFSLLFFPNTSNSNTGEFCYVYRLFLLMTIYCIHHHNIAVRCTKTGIKHGGKRKLFKNEQSLKQFVCVRVCVCVCVCVCVFYGEIP